MTRRQPYTFDRVVRMLMALALLLGAVWLINLLKGVLLPFCVAVLIAYMFEPFVQFNRQLLHLRGRIVAIFVTLFEAAFFCCVAGYFLIPSVIGEMGRMAVILRNYAATEMSNIMYLPGEVHEFLRSRVDFNLISSYLTTEQIGKLAESALSAGWSIVSGGISVILSIFSWCIVVLYVVFIMIDYERIMRGFRHMVPPKYRPIAFRVAGDVKRSMNHYFRGQALVAFLVGVLFAIGFTIIGLPMGVVLGLFIGVLNMVPYLQLISIVPTAVLCLVYAVGGGGDFWSIFLQSMAVYIIVQAIQDLWLTPKIMGRAMGLNPAIILLSLSVWGTLLGVIGLIIALPLTALLLSYYNRYVIERQDSGDEHMAAADRRAVDRLEDEP